MPTNPEVSTYREGDIYWAQASGSSNISAACAWKSLDRLLMRIIEIPTAGNQSVKILRANKKAPIVHVGNELIARASILRGVIKASMSMKVTECIPGNYLRLDVRTYNMSFAVIDFRIQSAGRGSQLRFRQGFRSRRGMSRSISEQTATQYREMPETARIFNMWLEFAQTLTDGDGLADPPLTGTSNA